MVEFGCVWTTKLSDLFMLKAGNTKVSQSYETKYKDFLYGWKFGYTKMYDPDLNQHSLTPFIALDQRTTKYDQIDGEVKCHVTCDLFSNRSDRFVNMTFQLNANDDLKHRQHIKDHKFTYDTSEVKVFKNDSIVFTAFFKLSETYFINEPLTPPEDLILANPSLINEKLFELVLNFRGFEQGTGDESVDEPKVRLNPDEIILMSNDEEYFRCSRQILSIQSNFFRSMFEDTKENDEQDSVLIMDDLDGATLTESLRYIYTEGVDDSKLVEVATSCLFAAEKFGLSKFKRYCAFILRKNLSAENAVTTLLAAEKCKDEELLKFVIKFVGTNLPSVRAGNDWSKLINGSFILIDKIFAHLAVKNENVVQ